MQQVLSGERNTMFCGAGNDDMGVAADGSLAPCYRFYENADYGMGHVETGIDTTRTAPVVEKSLDDKLACHTCWARYFCGGGCHHDNLTTTGKPSDPNPIYCEIMRHSMDRTLEMWGRLSSEGVLGGRETVSTEGTGSDMSQEPTVFRDDDKPRTTATCHMRNVGAERVVYEPVSHEVAFLNETAAWIFERCDGSRTVGELLAAMQAEFAADVEVLRADLLATLGMLRQKSLLG
jgi:radical SAM protein with 4Fe4S-binding SPASM domain